MAVLMLVLGFVAHLLYSQAEEWRLRAVIEERERLAHEIHDTLAQSFAGIGFQLRAIVNRVSKSRDLNPTALVEELSQACDLVRQSHDEARRTITTLRPDATEAGGLVAALRQTAAQMVGMAHVEIETLVEGELRSTPLQVLDSLFRIGQEAIANAVQHGHPSRLTISAIYTTSAIILIIEDNGTVFIPGQESDGFGLTGIRKRAETIHGTLAIETALGKGTRIIVEVPLSTNGRRFWPLPYHFKKSEYPRSEAG
jgi:signal transduction histidine kinase